MVLYQGMYNVAHFEINNNLQLYEDVLVGDEYDYKRLRKICFVSGTVYINKVIVEGSEIKGGAHVTIQDDSIFINIVPENESDGLVIGITFYLDDSGNMYAYTEKREGGPQTTIVESFNGRTGAVVPADTDYNAGLIGYNNEISQLVAENVQDAIDEIDQDIDNIQGEIDDLSAEQVSYDNSTSGLVSTTVQRAIDELDNDVSGKQDTLTFDSEPTATSNNPVTSDGIYHALETVKGMIPTDANEIGYDNNVSGLTANNVQSAIDEVNGKIPTVPVDSVFGRTGDVTASAHDYDADQIDYDNTTSGLVASDVQAAIDEVKASILSAANQISYDNSGSGISATDVQGAIDTLNSAAVQILDQTVTSLGDVIVNRTGILTISTAALQPASGVSVYGYVSYGSANQKIIMATRFGTNDTWINAAGDGYTFNGWTQINPQSGTLKYLGAKDFTFTYDGVKTCKECVEDLYSQLRTYIAGKGSNYRFQIQRLRPSPGLPETYQLNKEFYTNTFAGNVSCSAVNCDWGAIESIAFSSSAKCTNIVMSTGAYTDFSSNIESNGTTAYLYINEYEVI